MQACNIKTERSGKKKRNIKILLVFIVTFLLLISMFVVSILTGGLDVTLLQFFRGLFEYDRHVAIIVDIRFPRIFVAMLGGMAMAVAGVLMQAVMRNPLADPGIIGISSGSAFVAVIVTAFFPALSLFTPLFSFLGGLLAFVLVYALSWKGGLSSTRLILVGIAINALFTGLTTAFSQMTGNTYSGAASIVEANISLKTWSDVYILAAYVLVGAMLCIFCCKKCNLLALSDKMAGSLGVNVNIARFQISVVSVLLAAASTAIIGSVSFLGLIVPHIGRLLVGSDHKKLIPYSAILGALFFLTADTLGRLIAYPYEISASIVMSVIGAPVFIILFLRSKKYG